VKRALRNVHEVAGPRDDPLVAEPERRGALEDEEGLVLVPGEGVPMNEIASRILASKSGLTRVIDRMEEAGLVRRERPTGDRRLVLVVITEAGLEALDESRVVHRDGIRRHFTEHLDERDLELLKGMLQKVREHVRPLRPGRCSA
jgi:DNA-binding MarR family transcriptional regulator